MDSQLKEFTHASTSTPVYVDLGMVSAHWHSPGHKSTIIQTNGGALLPVKEDIDFVKQAREAYLKEKENNGPSNS